MLSLKNPKPPPQPKTDKQILGSVGENIAVEFLMTKGYQIIARNFKKRYGEIDIVALDRETLVFIEVKTRYSRIFGRPEEAITPWKLKALERSAYYYKMKHPETPEDLRIDVVAIELDPHDKVKRIELIKNVTN